MSKPIAIFYHVYLGGGEIPCNHDIVTGIVTDQMSALRVSKLEAAAGHYCVGVTGSELDAFMVKGMLSKGEAHHNGPGVGELPTMKMMQDWCRSNPGWNVLYIHTKGAIHNGNPSYDAWRRCMEKVVIWKWKDCVRMLDWGLDSVGAHWLTPAQYPVIGLTPYWGGNFWWATSDFLNTLPEINVNLSRYEAEVWIGRGPKWPKVRDLAPHFPMTRCSHD